MNKLKKHSVTKDYSELSLQPIISQSLEHFFLTVGQNNFGNKIPFVPIYQGERDKIPYPMHPIW